MHVPRPIHVALCDDNDMVRDALASYIAIDSTLALVASWASGHEALDVIGDVDVDVLLLDVRMSDLDGPAVARALAQRGERVRVVYLSSYPDEIPVDDALDGIVLGALTKDLAPDDLNHAIHLAATGTGLLSGQIRHRTRRPVTPPATPAPLAVDRRERAVLDLLCQGYTNDQIATQLNRSSSSVKQILSGLCRRAGVHSRVELVLYLMGITLATPSDDSPGR